MSHALRQPVLLILVLVPLPPPLFRNHVSIRADICSIFSETVRWISEMFPICSPTSTISRKNYLLALSNYLTQSHQQWKTDTDNSRQNRKRETKNTNKTRLTKPELPSENEDKCSYFYEVASNFKSSFPNTSTNVSYFNYFYALWITIHRPIKHA